MDQVGKFDLEIDSSHENLDSFVLDIAVNPAAIQLPSRLEAPQESSCINVKSSPVYSDSDESDIVINLDSEEPVCQPPENNNASNTTDDDDFCIIYEKYPPIPDVQVVNCINKPPIIIPRRNKKAHRVQHQRINSISIETSGHLPVENTQENLNPDSLDDSVCIIEEIPPVTANNEIINQEAILTSSEKKKRKIECGVCFDGPDEINVSGRNLVSTVCGHIFCSECIKMSLKAIKQCPQCRKKLTVKQYHPIYI